MQKQTDLVYNPAMRDSQQITVELPLPLYRFLERLAEQTHQPLEKLVAQSVAGNLPPSVENAPVEIQPDLLALQWQSIAELEQIAHEQIASKQQQRHFQLLEKDKLTPEEQTELAELRHQADLLMLRKAYAWAVLRWRGHPIPRLDEIPLE
jgi:hypothetical protein